MPMSPLWPISASNCSFDPISIHTSGDCPREFTQYKTGIKRYHSYQFRNGPASYDGDVKEYIAGGIVFSSFPVEIVNACLHEGDRKTINIVARTWQNHTFPIASIDIWFQSAEPQYGAAPHGPRRSKYFDDNLWETGGSGSHYQCYFRNGANLEYDQYPHYLYDEAAVGITPYTEPCK
jgi:hypothetical protein